MATMLAIYTIRQFPEQFRMQFRIMYVIGLGKTWLGLIWKIQKLRQFSMYLIN